MHWLQGEISVGVGSWPTAACTVWFLRKADLSHSTNTPLKFSEILASCFTPPICCFCTVADIEREFFSILLSNNNREFSP